MQSQFETAVVAAFTEEQVERLTGVSRRQLRAWNAAGFFSPSSSLKDLPKLKLYSFRDLVCLKVIDSLRNRAGVSFAELRRTKERLAHLGDDLWAKTTLYVLGKKVVFEDPATGGREEISSRQKVLEIPLRIATGEMESAVRALRRRDIKARGLIEKSRGLAQNQPVIVGTKIPVRGVKAFLEDGFSIQEICDQYPSLSREDIEAAIHFKDVA